MDVDNPVVQLCARGVAAEFSHDPAEARRSYLAAWERSSDHYEACIAAHYMSRSQTDQQEALRWSALALDHAEAADQPAVHAFYPSLYLQMGRSCEDLGQVVAAEEWYRLARESVAQPVRSPSALERDGPVPLHLRRAS